MRTLLTLILAAAFFTGCRNEEILSQGSVPSEAERDYQKITRLLSVYYKQHCVVCHGDTGEEGYAPILAQFSYSEFVHSVREGHPELHIPSFDASEYPDAALKRDVELIKGTHPSL